MFRRHEAEIEELGAQLLGVTQTRKQQILEIESLQAALNGQLSLQQLQDLLCASGFTREQLEICAHAADDSRPHDRSPKRVTQTAVDPMTLNSRRAARYHEAAMDHIKLTGQTIGGELNAQHLRSNKFHKGQLQIAYKTGNVRPGTYTRYISTEFGSVHNGTDGANWDCCSLFPPGHPQFCERCNAHAEGCCSLESLEDEIYHERVHSKVRSKSVEAITSTLVSI